MEVEEGRERSNIHSKIMSENWKYTISCNEDCNGNTFFLGSCISSFCPCSPSQIPVYDSACAWSHVPGTNIFSYVPGTTGNEQCCCGTHQTGQKLSTDVCTVCLCFKAWKIIWHLTENHLNVRVLVVEPLTRESQHWKSFYSNKENLIDVEKLLREEQKWQQLGWWVKIVVSSPNVLLHCAHFERV